MMKSMMKKKHYQSPQTEQMPLWAEENFCVSGEQGEKITWDDGGSSSSDAGLGGGGEAEGTIWD